MEELESSVGSMLTVPDRFAPALLQSSKSKLGEVLVEEGEVTPDDVARIVRFQQGRPSLRFGEAAVVLGLVNRAALDKALGIQFGYPIASQQNDTFSTELAGLTNPFGVESESLRALRSQLLMRWFDRNRKPLTIVSPEPREGRSYLAANLAVVFAQVGHRTLLIDADLRRPRQHLIFGLPSSIGLSTMLSARVDKCLPHQAGLVPSLFVLPAGPLPPNPQELLSLPVFTFLLQEAVEHFPVVIVDTPPANVYADAELVAARAGSALVVTCKDQTRVRSVRDLAARLGQNQTPVVGGVLVE